MDRLGGGLHVWGDMSHAWEDVSRSQGAVSRPPPPPTPLNTCVKQRQEFAWNLGIWCQQIHGWQPTLFSLSTKSEESVSDVTHTLGKVKQTKIQFRQDRGASGQLKVSSKDRDSNCAGQDELNIFWSRTLADPPLNMYACRDGTVSNVIPCYGKHVWPCGVVGLDSRRCDLNSMNIRKCWFRFKSTQNLNSNEKRGKMFAPWEPTGWGVMMTLQVWIF